MSESLDEFLLSHLSSLWRKESLVIGSALLAHDVEIPDHAIDSGSGADYISKRIDALAAEGHLEVKIESGFAQRMVRRRD